uniref:(northern house mosquito) hypothetical protein n=1 Tax=Culex pipiens TaxID=7175 RepID=A0A8D8FKU6_CULPI
MRLSKSSSTVYILIKCLQSLDKSINFKFAKSSKVILQPQKVFIIFKKYHIFSKILKFPKCAIRVSNGLKFCILFEFIRVFFRKIFKFSLITVFFEKTQIFKICNMLIPIQSEILYNFSLY